MQNKFSIDDLRNLLDTAEQTRKFYELLFDVRNELRMIRLMLEPKLRK